MLKQLFKPATFLDREVEAWQLETWAHLMARLGGRSALAETPLMLPTRDFFPATEATGHARAEHVFASVRSLMGMDDNWPCRLEAQPTRLGPQQVSAFVVVPGGDEPNGTFRVEPSGEVVISYAPDLVDHPVQMVATFAHELAHYLLAVQEPFGEELTHELATDLTVIYTGFGVFGANAAFAFEQHGDAFSQGWASQRNGYLAPRSWVFGLAVFETLKGEPGVAEAHLKPDLRATYRDALKYLAKRPEVLARLP